MRKTYRYDKLSIRNTDLYYQVANGDGEVWYQCSGISRILDLSAGSKLAASAAVQNKRPMSCEWIRNRNVSWFLNTEGIRDILKNRVRNPEYLSREGQKGYALLQSFVRMQQQPEQQTLPMPLPAPEPVKAEPVNTEASLAGLNVTPDAMARKMSSREIAELTGKNHKDVLRDIRTLENQGAINGRNFALVEYTDAKGEKRPAYELDFDATMTLVTGYNAVLRAKVIKRWRELETSTAVKQAPEPAPCKTWGKDNISTAAMLAEFKAWKTVAAECGLDNNAACISANGVLDRNYGVAPLQIARIQLIAPRNEQYLKPSDIADLLAKLGFSDNRREEER